MVSAARIWTFFRRLPVLILAAAAVSVASAAAVYSPAMAQVRQGWLLRDLLFPQRVERYEPPLDIQRPRPKTKKPRRAAPRKTVEPKTPVVEKKPEARVVLVIGDFMASGLAEGLEDVFAENPDILISDRSKGSSGFVRDDFYDWPVEIKPLLESEKPAVIVVMLGANDRQQMKIGGAREPSGSDAWTKEYEKRTEAFGEVIEAGKVPLLWVGMPAFRSSKMNSDMLAFNDIYKAAAEKSGGEFIDVWDGFVDENGAFVTSGPDINGQPVRLRSDDGINLSKAGKRKLAFYTEKPLLKILGLTSPSGKPAESPAGLPLGTSGETPPAAVDRTPPMLLNDPALDGGTELLGAAPALAADKGLPGEKRAVNGPAPGPLPGRADDFSWPSKQPAAKPATGGGDKTTAIKP